MANSIHIRPTVKSDHVALMALYPLAFPEEGLQSLVRSLLDGDADTVSLGAESDGDLVGHALFTLFADKGTPRAGALLGPVAVHPDHQHSGIGTTLIQDGVQRLTDLGVRQVLVLGDPAFYGRFGFTAEPDVQPPYQLPDDWQGAWQSIRLSDRAPLSAGPCHLAKEWMEPAFWSA